MLLALVAAAAPAEAGKAAAAAAAAAAVAVAAGIPGIGLFRMRVTNTGRIYLGRFGTHRIAGYMLLVHRHFHIPAAGRIGRNSAAGRHIGDSSPGRRTAAAAGIVHSYRRMLDQAGRSALWVGKRQHRVGKYSGLAAAGFRGSSAEPAVPGCRPGRRGHPPTS